MRPGLLLLISMLGMFSLTCALADDLTLLSAESSPSGNLLKRIADDYRVIHGENRYLPKQLSSPLGLVIIGSLIATDESSFSRIDTAYSGEAADLLTRSLNWLGSGAGALLVSGVLLSQKEATRKADGKLMLAAVVDANLSVEVIKHLTGRERPYESGGETIFHGPGLHFDSFPSGHAATSFAMAKVLAKRHPKQKEWCYALAALVSLGRIHKHKHFLSDVVVGAIYGLDSADRVLENQEEILAWRF